ncbi:TGF-beta-activated kinase 1 and MAP3K7-binding protein 3-like [Saccoglossus kowalevskii]|uniref:TGF-beta-activated kinase 1 and MAP3K7-binding protein 3-like n=1 Tax=Saccoglossus kowalevskii TaxID=10224 RepID=A0ABM0GIN2_SACKO|nr:PREDICTED: TGF-beta-activated kinase 1 and MAP3K7-binding protein 3-like [Saccoglossus kowalevskii]
MDHEIDTAILKRLKEQFPEIPTSVVCSCIQQNQNSYHHCVDALEKESIRYMYGPFESASSMDMSNQFQNLHLNQSEQKNHQGSNSSKGGLGHSASFESGTATSNEQFYPTLEAQSAPVVSNFRPFSHGCRNSPPKYTSTYMTNVPRVQPRQQQNRQQQQQQQQHLSQYTHSPSPGQFNTSYNRSPSGSFSNTTPNATTVGTYGYNQSPSQYSSTSQHQTYPNMSHYETPGSSSSHQQYTSPGSSRLSTSPQYVNVAPNTSQHYTSPGHSSSQQYASSSSVGPSQHYTSTAPPSTSQQYASPGSVSASTSQQYVVAAKVGHQPNYTSPGSTPKHYNHYSTASSDVIPYQPISLFQGGSTGTFTHPRDTTYGSGPTQIQRHYTGTSGAISPQPPPPSYSSSHYFPMNQPQTKQQNRASYPPSSFSNYNVRYQTQYSLDPSAAPGSTNSGQQQSVVSSVRYIPSQSSRASNLSSSPAEESLLNRSIEGTATPPPPIQPLSPASSHSSLLESPLDDQQAATSGLTKEQEDYAYTQALLLHQKARCDRLIRDLEVEKKTLENFRREVEGLETELMDRKVRSSQLPRLEHIARLRAENRMLQTDINCMSKEVEVIANENDAEQSSSFYGNFTTGAPGPVPPKPPTPSKSAHSMIPPARPPPPLPAKKPPPPPPVKTSDPDEGQQWSCVHCTFLNHPALDKCETCEMPRVV